MTNIEYLSHTSLLLWHLTVLSAAQLHFTPRQCSPPSVVCNNTNICIDTATLCDGYNDCHDLEDESRCPTHALLSILTSSGHPAILQASNNILTTTATSPDPAFTQETPSACQRVAEVHGVSGVITSPNYFSPTDPHYPSFVSCGWHIRGPPASFIILHFDDFQLENSPECRADSLTIYDGASDRAPLLERTCGKYRPGEVLTTGRHAFLHLVTDTGVEGRGFSIAWRAVSTLTTPTTTLTTPTPAPGCDGHALDLTSPGSVTSPYYDGKSVYPSFQTCRWVVTGPPGYVITFKFTSFELEYTPGCEYDYLEIYDGADMSSAVRTLCGERPPDDVTTTSNMALVKFVSDAEVAGIGFNATFIFHRPTARCAPDEFTCRPGSCIPQGAVCDGVDDCSSGGDEAFCASNLCGRPNIPPSLDAHRIVGGQEAVPGSWPWQVSLRMTGKHLCGGSLIADTWVLTAAHCFDSNWRLPDWSVMAGLHSLRTSDPHQQLFNISRIIIHPEYVSLTSDNDVALVHLTSAAHSDDYVSLICPPSAALSPGTMMYITGFGETLTTCCAEKLKQAAVPLIDTRVCNTSDYPSRVLQHMVCAGYQEGGTDTCGGDSGGPLVHETGGHWVLYGVTSWGVSCGELGMPGVYMIVLDYLEWIRETISKNS